MIFVMKQHSGCFASSIESPWMTAKAGSSPFCHRQRCYVAPKRSQKPRVSSILVGRRHRAAEKVSAAPASTSSIDTSATEIEKTDLPSVRIIDGDGSKDYTILLDVPGYSIDALNVTVFPDTAVSDAAVLKIEGRRINRLHSASFVKKFRLRDSRLQLDKVTADLSKDGLLTVALPKKTDSTPMRRVIPIRGSTKKSEHGMSVDGGMSSSEMDQYEADKAGKRGVVGVNSVEVETVEGSDSEDEPVDKEEVEHEASDEDEDDEDPVDIYAGDVVDTNAQPCRASFDDTAPADAPAAMKGAMHPVLVDGDEVEDDRSFTEGDVTDDEWEKPDIER